MPHEKVKHTATCPYCHGTCGNGTAYLDHTRRCVKESDVVRAYYVLHHRWPAQTPPPPRPARPTLF